VTAKAKAASSPKKGGGAAARSETNGHREAEVFGIKLELASEVPSTFSLDLAVVQSGDGDLGDVLHLLKALGVTEEQFREYRDKVSEGEVKIGKDEDALFKFTEAVLSEFGTSAGESLASDGS
jgi:hypothetical protein